MRLAAGSARQLTGLLLLLAGAWSLRPHIGPASAAINPATAETFVSGTIRGGPFQRVVYNARTHIAIATPGLFREEALEFRAPSIRYNDITRIAWAAGPCAIRSGPSSATSRFATADFARREVVLSGGVQFQIAGQGRPAILVSLSCPNLTYSSQTGIVSCSGGVSGRVTGLTELPLSTGAASQTGAIQVRAASLNYDSKARRLTAWGGVTLSQADASIQSPALTLDASRSVLQLSGGIRYLDGLGRQLEGASATDDLRNRTVTVSGPISYKDRAGNQMQAGSSQLDQRTHTVHFTLGVRYTDPHGMQVTTPFASIQFAGKQVTAVQTGPVSVSGTTALSPS